MEGWVIQFDSQAAVVTAFSNVLLRPRPPLCWIFLLTGSFMTVSPGSTEPHHVTTEKGVHPELCTADAARRVAVVSRAHAVSLTELRGRPPCPGSRPDGVVCINLDG